MPGDLTLVSALDLAEEMGLNRKALEALTQDGQAAEAVRLHGTACRSRHMTAIADLSTSYPIPPRMTCPLDFATTP